MKKSIQSILDQTFKDFEFLIINDKSMDSSAEIIQSFKTKTLLPSQLLETYIANIEAKKNLNAFISTNFDEARKQALEADEKFKNNQPTRPLEGIPIAVKDLFCTKGIKTISNCRRFS